ncbi:Uncharacterised protein [uncultured archaeon]|nr:Uncharacterised protein [uncultured archaeon]
MNDKETKVPIYIAIIVALILVAAAGYYVLGKPAQPKAPQLSTDTSPTPTPAATVAPTGSTSTTVTTTTQASPVTTIKCELCHTNAKDLSPHVNGGKLCINCHGSQVHNIHIGEGTVNLDCKTCHGFPPKIPTVQPGKGPGSYSVCEQCHAPPPDNTKPSNGNLILIHLSRGKYCTNCHGTDIQSIHAAALANATKSTAPSTAPTGSPAPTNAST